MRFSERYQFLDLVEDDGVKTFIALEVSTGRKITIFLFEEEQVRLQAELLGQLRAADRAQLPELIDFGGNQSIMYAVLEPLIDFAELKKRVARLKTLPTPYSEKKMGEFTAAGIWRVPPSLQSTPSPAEMSSEESAPFDKQPFQPDASTAPGSFSQIFQAAEPPIREPKAEAIKTPSSPIAQPGPGEFTRMFQAAALSIEAAQPAPTEVEAVQPAPELFSQMFQAAEPPIGEPKAEAIKAPSPPIARPGPGEFTSMFQAAAPSIEKAKPAPTEVEAAQPAPELFSQMFQAAGPPIGEPKADAIKASPAQAAPGEFTRFFNAASSIPPAPAQTPLEKPKAQGEFESIFGRGGRAAPPQTTVTGIFNQSSLTPAMKQGQAENAATPAPPPAPASPSDEFTKLFGGTSSEIPMPGPIAAPPAPSEPPPKAPGEYTRIFGTSQIPQKPVEPPPAQAPIKASERSAPVKRNSKLVPVLIIATVLLLAAITVILVMLKK